MISRLLIVFLAGDRAVNVGRPAVSQFGGMCIIRAVFDLRRVVPALCREVPDLCREVPGLCREVPGLCRMEASRRTGPELSFTGESGITACLDIPCTFHALMV